MQCLVWSGHPGREASQWQQHNWSDRMLEHCWHPVEKELPWPVLMAVEVEEQRPRASTICLVRPAWVSQIWCEWPEERHLISMPKKPSALPCLQIWIPACWRATITLSIWVGSCAQSRTPSTLQTRTTGLLTNRQGSRLDCHRPRDSRCLERNEKKFCGAWQMP